MLKHIYIAQPYDSKESLITYINNNHQDKYNHLIFDDNNRLVKVVKMNPYSNDIANMSLGNVYNFKGGFPEPYYNFFHNYFDDVNIYSIVLDNNQIKDLKLANKLVNMINNFDNLNNNLITEDNYLKDLSDEYIKVYEDFVNKYTSYSYDYNNDELNNFKIIFIKDFLQHKANQYDNFIYSHMKH
jgi:hypothetical protein